jgi:hypothetical protein
LVSKKLEFQEFELRDLVKKFQLKESEEVSVEHFGHQPQEPRCWKEDQLPKGEDEVCLESDLGSYYC